MEAKTLDRIIYLAQQYESGEITREKSTQEIAEMLGCATQGAVYAFKELGFTQSESKQVYSGGSSRRLTYWTPPEMWPAKFARARQLRRLGFSMEKIKETEESPCVYCGEKEKDLIYFMSDGSAAGVMWVWCETCYEEVANSIPPVKYKPASADLLPEAEGQLPQRSGVGMGIPTQGMRLGLGLPS